MIVRDTSVVPPNGWRYIQPETAMEFRAATLRMIVKQVEAHRKANGLPEGNPHLEIQRFVCTQLPLGSEDCKAEIEGMDGENYSLKMKFDMTDVTRFIEAAIAAIGDRGLVEPHVAEDRARVCASCPMNMKVTGCWQCATLADLLFRLIGTRTTAYASKLRQCGVCGCSLKAKIWLPLDVAQKVSEGHHFPSWCWLQGTERDF